MGAVAMVFGIASIKEGGAVLFLDGDARQAAGHFVLFVLGFNVFAGLFYVIAGAGFWLRQAWSVVLAGLIAAATIVVFIAFGFHIWSGGAFEIRTVAAMSLRSLVWIIVALTSHHVMRIVS